MPTQEAVHKWLKANKLVIHHYKGDEMQIVPEALHGGLHHQDSARQFAVWYPDSMSALDDQLNLNQLKIEPILERFGPATPAEVNELEQKLQRSLPSDYRHFLLNYGHSGFEELVSAPLPDDDEAPISVFFGGDDSGEPVLKQFERFDDGARAGILPFARDPFGNLFLIDIGSSGPGTVKYARFEDDGLVAVPLADSFEDFLMGLTVEAFD